MSVVSCLRKSIRAIEIYISEEINKHKTKQKPNKTKINGKAKTYQKPHPSVTLR